MKKVRGDLVLLVFLLTSAALAAQPETKPLDQRIRDVENGLVEHTFDEKFGIDQTIDTRRADSLPKLTLLESMQKLKIPGVSIAVIDNFEITWTKGYGVMEAGTGRAVTPDTLFQSGSTTKLLMVITILRMVEEGKLALDADINTYLETWKVPAHPSGKKVTLRLLLTHRSGINRPGDGFYKEPGSMPTLLQFLKGERPVQNDGVAFDHEPGTKHSYSNFGYLVMQYLLEDHFHAAYATLVDRYVFRPLKLESSFIAYPFPSKFATRVIRPHDKDGKPVADDGLETFALAQAGMITTPADWARIVCELMRAYQGKSNRLLSPASVRAMFQAEAALNPAEFDGISTQGLGVFLIDKESQKYFLHHGHNSPGANCLALASTTSGKGLIVMTNGMRGLRLAIQLITAVSREYGWDGPDAGGEVNRGPQDGRTPGRVIRTP